MIVTARTMAWDEMASANHQPARMSQMMLPIETERSRAEVLAAGDSVARNGAIAEGQQSIGGDVERRPRPGQADDRHRHDDAGQQPPGGHPKPAGQQP